MIHWTVIEKQFVCIRTAVRRDGITKEDGVMNQCGWRYNDARRDREEEDPTIRILNINWNQHPKILRY